MLFFGAATAFDYAVFDLIAEDSEGRTGLVAAIPLAVVAAAGGSALYAVRGRAPLQTAPSEGWAIAVPWWSFFFTGAGVVALAAAAGAGGEPHGTTRGAGILIGVVFCGLGLAPIVAGLGVRPAAAAGHASTRVAALAAELLIALTAISVTLGLMDSLRGESDRALPVSEPAAPEPVGPTAEGSLFRSGPLSRALEELGEQAPPGWRIQTLRIEPNALWAELEVDAGRVRVSLDRNARVVRREDLGPVPVGSFSPALIDAGVCERIGRSLRAAGGPGLGGVTRVTATATTFDGRPGWAVFGADSETPTWRAKIGGRVSAH